MDKAHLRLFTPLESLDIPDIGDASNMSQSDKVAIKMQKKGLVRVKEEITDIIGRTYPRHKWVKAK